MKIMTIDMKKISQTLREYREFYFKNNRCDLPAYDVLMNYEDFRTLLKEDEARLGYRQAGELHWFEDFHIFRTQDIKKGTIKIIASDMDLYL